MNRKNVYNEHIESLVQEVKLSCYEHRIPMFFSAAICDEHGKTEYKNVMISPALVDTRLSDDRISKMVNVMNGFDTVPPSEVMEIEF